MTSQGARRWEAKRTDETRWIENVLLQKSFDRVDLYRYNLASNCIRVVDRRFEGLPSEGRDAIVEPYLEQLPEHTQVDIVSLFTFAPSDLEQSQKSFREFMKNLEFEDPSPSML